MNDSRLALDDRRFITFFREVTGFEPFAWQLELARRLLQGGIPDVIDVPTGLGKTSVLHIWAYALAAHLASEESAPRKIPLRLFLVVDRRIIVDSTFTLAQKLKAALESPPSEATVAPRVAELLRTATHGAGPSLAVVRMRGGATWDARWLDRPDQPAIVTSTVDQFGSRLLFRGYGVSSSLLPINAALCGTDAWVIIDEAHIAAPLVETIERIQRLQGPERQEGLRPIMVTTMSATHSATGVRSLVANPGHECDAPEVPQASAIAARRLSVRKPAQLKEIDVAGKGIERYRRLGEQLAALLKPWLALPSRRLAVLCNTVQAARAAFDSLRKGDTAEVDLLIGRVRAYERDPLVKRVLQRFGAGEPRAGQTSVLVATQTIEVGADLDFDAIITECAPLSALVQRFGRVRRLGTNPGAEQEESMILYASKVHAQDPIYGAAPDATWKLLQQHATGRPPRIDFDQASIQALRSAATPQCEPAPEFVPVLLGAHVERWAQTAPIPTADQAVAPFLHGFRKQTLPVVFVAWRAVPPPPDGIGEEEQWQRWLDLAPLTDWEYVDVPLPEVRAFIAGRDLEGPTSDLAALEGERVEEQKSDMTVAFGKVARAVMLDDEGMPRLIHRPDDIQPFATVILDVREGGHDRWGWTGRRDRPEQVVPDVADLAPSRQRRSLRLAPAIAASFAPERQTELREAWQRLDSDDPATTAVDVLTAFTSIVPSPLADLYRLAAEGLKAGTWEALVPEREGENRWFVEEEGRPVLRIVERGSPADAELADQSDEDPVSTSLSGRRPIGLADHGDAVGRLARELAERIGLSAPLIRAVELAGRYHDLGKTDPRFQVLLYDGDALAAAAGTLRAKSGRDPRDPVARRAWRLAGLPEGFRHEALSGRLFRTFAERHPNAFAGIDRDLVHHLIIAHHGRARPLLPAVEDRAATAVVALIDDLSLTVEPESRQIDWEHPTVFERLCAKYGWWGLALLEAIVRLADMKVSEG